VFGRIGRFAFDHRVAVLMFGALTAVLSIAVASGLQDVLQEGGFTDPGSESGRAQAILKAELGRPAVPDLLLIVDAAGDIRETQTAVDHYRLYARTIAQRHRWPVSHELPETVPPKRGQSLGRRLRASEGLADLMHVELILPRSSP